jgi:hypothetical protein
MPRVFGKTILHKNAISLGGHRISLPNFEPSALILCIDLAMQVIQSSRCLDLYRFWLCWLSALRCLPNKSP